MLFALPFLAAFQIATQPPAAQIYNGQLGQTRVAIPKLPAEITVDGNLDEPVWAQAALLNGFALYSPADQRPAPDSTQVLAWYSTNAIHFGIRAFEPHGSVTATLADRDHVQADDNVELQLDTFNEHDRALVFIVNPLGVQADGTKSETGGFIPGSNVAPGQDDLSADFQWSPKGTSLPGGMKSRSASRSAAFGTPWRRFRIGAFRWTDTCSTAGMRKRGRWRDAPPRPSSARRGFSPGSRGCTTARSPSSIPS